MFKHLSSVILQQHFNFSGHWCKSMPKAILKYTDGLPSFSFSFEVECGPQGGQKELNFSRSCSETVAQFVNRVTSNVTKVLNKASKKDKTSGSNFDHVPRMTVELIKSSSKVALPEDLCLPILLQPNARFRIGDWTYDIDINPPAVKCLRLPSHIMCGYQVYPEKLELENCSASDVLMKWYTSQKLGSGDEGPGNTKGVHVDKDSWRLVSSGFFFMPSIDDIDRKVKLVCTPRIGDRTGRAVEAISGLVGSGPGPCPFDVRHLSTPNLTSHGSFRVISYNILADLYTDSDYSKNVLFPYCPPYALAMDYRVQLILRELMGYKADIIGLQEVDSQVYKRHLNSVLSLVGFDGLFEKKGGQVSEGLALFYRTSKFELVTSNRIVLAEELMQSPLTADLWSKISKYEELANRISQRTTALVVAVLRSREVPDKFLVVGNTHLYFHPDADHIRILQAGICLLYMEQMVALLKTQNPTADVSPVFCGDFNSTPECGVFQLMLTQHIPEDYLDWSSDKSEPVSSISLSHSLSLDSACGTPDFTHFQTGFSGCLDYIFYDKNLLSVEQVVPFYMIDELSANTALPSIVFPSDHIALVADLKFKNPSC